MSTPRKTAPRKRPEGPFPTLGPRWTGWLLFALALALRVLFWRSTPDSTWPYSAWYRGDAETWLAWAQALQSGATFEVGLPIRPPGASYLIAALWNGDPSGIATLKLAWCLIGALTVAVIYIAVLRSFGRGLATWVGLCCAGASGLMVLSTSLNNEAPYLLVVAATLALWQPLWTRPRGLPLVAWSSLHALACLIRAEHLLYFALLLGLLAWRWWRTEGKSARRSTVRRVALSSLTFAIVLLPWHLHAWAAIDDFNRQPPKLDPGSAEALRRIEQLVSWITWSPEAEARLEGLPAAIRPTARMFVATTEGVRGRSRVEAGSFDILDEAFGSIPQPLTAHPYVVLYGPLNFYLANNPGNLNGGFSRAPLELRPPLQGGIERYPIALVRQLPPRDLTLTYPPHLEAVNHGYRLGWEWIRGAPGDFFRLAGLKVRNFWNGAALGLGGYSLPLGLSGIRLQVDLIVPAARVPVLVWRLLLAALVASGLWLSRRDPATIPWAAFLLTKLIVAVAFFGYARQGATVIPVVALFVCLAIRATLLHPAAAILRNARVSRASAVAPILVAVLLLGIEIARWRSHPIVLIDGRTVEAAVSDASGDHRDRRIEVR